MLVLHQPGDIARPYTLSKPNINRIPLYILEIFNMPSKHKLNKQTYVRERISNRLQRNS